MMTHPLRPFLWAAVARAAFFIAAFIFASDSSAAANQPESDYDVTSSFVLPSSYKDPISSSTSGGWIQMLIEDTSSLSITDFVSKYVNTGTPVVLRRSVEDSLKYPAEVTPEWLMQNCDLKGGITNFGQVPGKPSLEWGGFLDAEKDHITNNNLYKEEEEEDSSDDEEEDKEDKKVTLSSYLKYLPHAHSLAKTATSDGRIYYGFDYDIKCHCAPLLDAMPWYAYFRDDVFLLDPAHADYVWPSLLVGPAGSSSALHVDNSYAPFHLTLLSGKKLFRVVRLADWRYSLTTTHGPTPTSKGYGPLYDSDGDVVNPADGFDDEVVKEEFIRKRGCHVFNVTLLPGDMVYVPTGALHGALNLGDSDKDEPAVAVTSNILNPAHAGQVLEEYCQKSIDSKDRLLCRKLGIDRDLERGVLGQEGNRVKPVEGAGSGVSYNFWEHVLGHPGFCDKWSHRRNSCPHVAKKCQGRTAEQIIRSSSRALLEEEEGAMSDDEEL